MSNTSTIKQTPIAAITSRQQDSDAAIRRVIESIGFPASGVYLPPSDAPYISSVTALFSTNVILAENLYRVETNFAPRTYVDQKVADIVDNAPAVLDTLRELSASLGDNPNLLGTLTSTINTEVTRATSAEAAISSLISTVVTSSINAEISRATAADAALSTTLATEVSQINANISTIVTSTINAEIERAMEADNALSTTIGVNFSTTNIFITSSITSTVQYIDKKITDVIGNAPAILDTLKELADSIGGDSNIFGTLTSSISNEISRAITVEQTLSTNITSTTIALQSELRAGLTSTSIYVDTQVSTVVANAPSLLDTLSELATALNGDPHAVVNITSTVQASNEYISSTKFELLSTINYITETNTAILLSQGLQSYNATSRLYRQRYTGPYAPSTFSTLYSTGGKSPYDHITNRGASILIDPTVNDNTTSLPSYSTTWVHLGTIDLTNSGSNTSYDLSTLPTSYSGSSIPYYDIHIDPKKLYGSNTNYGYVKGTSSSQGKQVHQAHILTYANSTSYSATPLGGSWVSLYKDDIPELERLIRITNINTQGNEINLFIQGGNTTFEIAPNEHMQFLYTNSGWLMGIEQ